MRIRLALSFMIVGAFGACSGANGTEGSSCVNTNNCVRPLRCIDGFCQTALDEPDGGVRDGGVVPPDAGEPEDGGVQGVWNEVTDDTQMAAPYIHFVSPTLIYAVIGQQICKWDGTAWIPLTADAPAPIGPYFHFIAEDNIYAILGQQVCKWDGTAWLPISDENPNLVKGALHYVSVDEIYAYIGQQICVWDGTAWLPHTAENADLDTVGFHFVSPDQIYAKIAEQICKWDGTTWLPLSANDATLKADFQFYAEDNIYAVLGQQICQWDGTSWVPITPDAPVPLTPAFYRTGDGTFYAVATNGKVYSWAP